MVRGALMVAVLLASGSGTASATYDQDLARLTRELPASVRTFIDRRVICNHWMGEEPYDAQRRAQIQSAIAKLRCDRLEGDEAALRRRQARNGAVLKALDDSKDWSP